MTKQDTRPAAAPKTAAKGNNLKEPLSRYQEGDYEGALELLLEAYVEGAEQTELSYYLGLCYAQLKKYDEALLYLEQVASDTTMGFEIQYQSRMLLGYIYAITDRHRLAEFEFQRMLEDGYESAKVYAALAYVTYLQKRAAGAISYLEKALAIDPTNANALNSLGYILADQEINLDTALRYCVQAVKHNPKSPAYLDSLGWAYFKQGDVVRARAAIDRARKMAPGNGEIAGHWDALQRDAG